MEQEVDGYKVLVVGNAAVGKTSLIQRLVKGIFNLVTRQTIGIDFAIKTVQSGDGKKHNLQLWDIGGQERYEQMVRVYFTSAKGALVVTDLTHENALEFARKWKQKIDEQVLLPDDRQLPCILLLNKEDKILKTDPAPYSTETLDDFCQCHGFLGWYFTSAKTGKNINESVTNLAELMVGMSQQEQNADPSKSKIQLVKATNKKKKCC